MRLNVTRLRALLKMRKRRRAGHRKSAYTVESAVEEDKTRRRRVAGFHRRQAKGSPLRRAAKRLRKRFVRSAETLASAVYSHDLHQRLVDHLVRLTWRLADKDLRVAALIPRRSLIRVLGEISANRFMNRLRADLDGVDGRKARGWVFAGMHGEYDPIPGKWRPHYHLVIVGREMIEVVDRLRDRGKYTIASINDEAEDGRTPPVRLQKVNRDHLRYALSYAAQTWWPRRRRTEDGNSRRMRIPEPQHTEWLLWMDEQRPQDMFLLYNLRVGKDGLTPTRGKRCANRGSK